MTSCWWRLRLHRWQRQGVKHIDAYWGSVKTEAPVDKYTEILEERMALQRQVLKHSANLRWANGERPIKQGAS